ncbi:MAG: type V toxin-antitoxin system endoribonuclease antitoxin GhoS [Vitreimonas sp.]
MTGFIVRVELHNAVSTDYDKLHLQMQARGFTRNIKSGDGDVYELPPAEYEFIGNQTRSQVLELAKAAAAIVKPSYAVVVTEYVGVTWSGLKKVAAARRV